MQPDALEYADCGSIDHLRGNGSRSRGVAKTFLRDDAIIGNKLKDQPLAGFAVFSGVNPNPHWRKNE